MYDSPMIDLLYYYYIDKSARKVHDPLAIHTGHGLANAVRMRSACDSRSNTSYDLLYIDYIYAMVHVPPPP